MNEQINISPIKSKWLRRAVICVAMPFVLVYPLLTIPAGLWGAWRGSFASARDKW